VRKANIPTAAVHVHGIAGREYGGGHAYTPPQRSTAARHQTLADARRRSLLSTRHSLQSVIAALDRTRRLGIRRQPAENQLRLLLVLCERLLGLGEVSVSLRGKGEGVADLNMISRLRQGQAEMRRRVHLLAQ
jgi:multidrug efflux pump subunit AcrA (membrane-fusion protein)